MLDFYFLIAQKIEVTRYTRILDSKPLICTNYHIGHRLEWKYFPFSHTFLLNDHLAGH